MRQENSCAAASISMEEIRKTLTLDGFRIMHIFPLIDVISNTFHFIVEIAT